MTKSKKSYYFYLELITLVSIVLSLFIQFFHANLDSWTVDEPLHIKSGVEWVTQGHSPTDPFNPPASKLVYGIIYQINPNLLLTPFLTIPRLTTIFLTLSLLLLFYFWVKSHIGQVTATFATIILAFEPNILAFGHLATTELAATLVFFLAFIAIHRYSTRSSQSNIHLVWIILAITAATKLTLIPALAVALLIIFRKHPKQLLKLISISGIITAIFILASLHFFKAQPILDSSTTVILGEFINTLLRTANYVFNPKFNSTRFLVYFEEIRGYGWFTYPLVTLLLKTSPILLSGSIFGFLYSKNKKFIWPAISLFFIVTIGRYSTGVRHLLPIYPFLALFAGEFISKISKSRYHFLAAIIIIYTIFASTTTDDFISYFNPLLGSKLGGRIISDSNLDWGQNIQRLSNQYPNQIDLISSRTPISPIVYGLKTPQLPLPHQLTANLLRGKTVAISRHNWYTFGYYKHEFFRDLAPEYAVSNTFFIFRFE